MDHILSPADVEARVKRAGGSVAELCKIAGIAHSTFTRWRASQTSPSIGVYRRLRDAMQIIEENVKPASDIRTTAAGPSSKHAALAVALHDYGPPGKPKSGKGRGA